MRFHEPIKAFGNPHSNRVSLEEFLALRYRTKRRRFSAAMRRRASPSFGGNVCSLVRALRASNLFSASQPRILTRFAIGIEYSLLEKIRKISPCSLHFGLPKLNILRGEFRNLPVNLRVDVLRESPESAIVSTPSYFLFAKTLQDSISRTLIGAPLSRHLESIIFRAVPSVR
jgi:hypothetical protein